MSSEDGGDSAPILQSEEPIDDINDDGENEDLRMVAKEEKPLANGDFVDMEFSHESNEEGDLREKFVHLNNTVKYLSHQLSMIMKTLHVPACPCALCGGQFTPNGVTPPVPMASQSMPGSDYAQRLGGGKFPSIIDRRTVSEYAQQHGGLAAVRKFGVPAPVASYYQRKDSRTQLGGSTGSPGPSNETADGLEIKTESAPTTPLLGHHPVMESMLRNSAHTGSPGFLRGRGRGRPKLIGDELDADLVEYMVQLKSTDPNVHFSASQALEIARAYILDKAPGLLEEHGGHVKLKLTWAMKLVSRIGERQKEIELGLPPGTLQNMGKTQVSQQLAEMMALTQFGMAAGPMPMMPNINPNGLNSVSATPEILSVRELDLSHLSGPSQDDCSHNASGTPEIVAIRELDLSHLGEGSSHSGELPVIGTNGEILFPDHDNE